VLSTPFRQDVMVRRAPRSAGRSRCSLGQDLNPLRAEALCFSVPLRTEVPGFAVQRGSKLPSVVEGQSFESFFDSSFATQLLRFRCREPKPRPKPKPRKHDGRINLRGTPHPQADGEPLRSGVSPLKRRLPSRHWPKPNRTLVRGPPVVMLPLQLAGFPASPSVGHRLGASST